MTFFPRTFMALFALDIGHICKRSITFPKQETEKVP